MCKREREREREILFSPLVSQEGIISFVVVSAGIIWSWQYYVSTISVLYLTITTRSESKLAYHLYGVPRWHSGEEKNLPSQAGDKRCRCNPWVGKIPWSGHGNPLQYSCLKNSMNRGAYWVTVHGVPKSQRWLNTHTHTHTYIHIPHLYKILVIRFCSKCLSGEHILYQVFSDTFWLVISNLT